MARIPVVSAAVLLTAFINFTFAEKDCFTAESCSRTPGTNITTVYLVSSCHLDVGFANTSVNIVNEYFDVYFPATIDIVKEMQQYGLEETLVFTTHPFLVYLYINCYKELGLHCPSAQSVADFTAAVHSGHITWHAFPFNAELEFYDTSLAAFGFQVTHELDKMFGRNKTITMSQRDVPGTTRSLIPLMVANGVQALTVGVNTVSMPPAVPSVFRWQDPVSDTEVLAMWHPHGYGGQSGPSLDSVVTVPGMPVALAFAIRGDNSGPPMPIEVVRNYEILRKLFPGAKVVASGYDAFVEELVKYRSVLPVYTEEIGDTWIQGVASDPWKTAIVRETMRLRSECLTSGECSMSDERFIAFSMMLLKSGEHTWGKDVKTYLHDTTNWSNAKFHAVQNQSNFVDMVDSWIEQRVWGASFPVELLGDHPLRVTIQSAIDSMRFYGEVATNGYKQIDISTLFKCGGLELQFSDTTGAIVHLVDMRSPSNPVTYANSSHQLAEILYQTYTSADYNTFFSEYFYDFGPAFARLDFGKPGWNGTLKVTVTANPQVLWYREDDNTCSFILHSQFHNQSTVVTEFGGSAALWTGVVVPKTTSPDVALSLNITLYITNKTSTRIPESYSFYFNPVVANASAMTISKLGEYISVLDVMKNGSKHLHASDMGIRYPSGPSFYARDTSLVCIGYPTPFPTPMEQPDVSQGFSFNIYNNIWGTNYIMWYPYLPDDASSKYEFQMTFPPV